MDGQSGLHISVGPLVTLWAVGFALCFCMWRGLWWPTLQSVLWLAAVVWPANKLVKETPCHSARSSISIEQ